MQKKSAWLWIAILLLASSLNYAAANLFIIIWKVELPYYILMVFALSAITGTLMPNLRGSIIGVFISMIGGLLIAIAIFFAPYIIFAESVVRFNVAALVLFSFLAKIFLVSVVVYFLGAVVGSFLSASVLSRD